MLRTQGPVRVKPKHRLQTELPLHRGGRRRGGRRHQPAAYSSATGRVTGPAVLSGHHHGLLPHRAPPGPECARTYRPWRGGRRGAGRKAPRARFPLREQFPAGPHRRPLPRRLSAPRRGLEQPRPRSNPPHPRRRRPPREPGPLTAAATGDWDEQRGAKAPLPPAAAG